MTITPEQIAAAKQAYEVAQQQQEAAKKNLEALKASQEPVTKAFEQAKAAYEGLRPSLALAKAQLQGANAAVTMAQLSYAAVAPKEASTRGTGNSGLLTAVRTFLADKPNGSTNAEIYDGLVAAGVPMAGAKARDNLNAYLSRWGASGALVSKGQGVWGPVVGTQAPTAPATTPEVPAFLGGAAPEAPAAAPEVPAFLGGTPAPTALDAEFPGFEPLSAAGLTHKEMLAGKTQEDLVAIPGIGAKTAAKILEALA